MDPVPVFVALGDIHLSDFIWTRQRQITGDAWLGLDSVFNASKALGVPLVLVGDIFDVIDPQSHLLKGFRERCERHVAGGGRILAIQGNHDRRPTPWYQAVTDCIQHVGDGRPADIGGLMVSGLDYASKDDIHERLSKLPALDVLFLHQAVKQRIPWEGAWNMDLEVVPKNVKRVVLGDIHEPWEFGFGDNQIAYYTGSGHPRSWGEVGQKSCLVMMSDLTTRRVDLPGRPMKKFSVKVPQDVLAVKSWLTSAKVGAPLPALAWVVHAPELAGECLALTSEYQDCIIVLEAGLTEVQFTVVNTDLPTPPVLTPQAFLPHFLQPDDPDYALAHELLNPMADIQEVLTIKRAEVLNAAK